LGVVIKDQIKDIPEEEAQKHILGYTCVNDVTARDLQKKDGQWTRAKSFDTFSPVGPCIETELDPGNLSIRSFLNGEIQQNSSTSDMIFGINELVSYISRVMTLMPGDIISTGTPPGIGPMSRGDKVSVEIEGIGSLENTIR
jgi:2-keto-4-pentenoate hydratase/2-oxohepta-3-ene-1,7-dioic acid hydratase in catechol pathway